MNIDLVFKSLVGLGATWVLWALIGLSVIGVGIILERWIFFFTTRQNHDALRSLIDRSFDGQELTAVRRRLDELPSIEARILGAGLGSKNVEEAEERMAAETQLQRIRSERSLAFLGTLGNNAPFIGLLGTVVGIIGAFGQLDASGGQLTTGLMAEIGEALIATAVGLVVALPAVAAYNTFQRTIAVRLGQGDAIGRHLLAAMLGENGEVASARPPRSERRGKEAQ